MTPLPDRVTPDMPLQDGLEQAMFGMGCFWGAEKMFWKIPGVKLSAVGYAGGHTDGPNWPVFIEFAEREFRSMKK